MIKCNNILLDKGITKIDLDQMLQT